MSTENSDSGPGMSLSLVAQFDDINRLNGILNDGAAEECKFTIVFIHQIHTYNKLFAIILYFGGNIQMTDQKFAHPPTFNITIDY